MRAFLALCAACALAAPADAQSLPAPSAGTGLQAQMDLQLRLNALQAQQDVAQRQAVIQYNEMTALDARLRTQQALADIRAQGVAASLPPPPPGAPPRWIDTDALASIPDAVLAASDARVRAAAHNRR